MGSKPGHVQVELSANRFAAWGQGLAVGLVLFVTVAALVLPVVQRQSVARAAGDAHFGAIIETVWPREQFKTYLGEVPRNELVALPASGLTIHGERVQESINALLVFQGPTRLSPLRFPPTKRPSIDGWMVTNHTIAQEYGIHLDQFVTVAANIPTFGSWSASASVASVAMTPENLWDGVDTIIWSPKSAWSLVQRAPQGTELPVWIISSTVSPTAIKVPGSRSQLLLTKTTLVTRMLRTIMINPGWIALSGLLWTIGLVWLRRSRQSRWVEWIMGSSVTLAVLSYVTFWHGVVGFTIIPVGTSRLAGLEAGLWVLGWAAIGGIRRLWAPGSVVGNESGPPNFRDEVSWLDFDPLD